MRHYRLSIELQNDCYEMSATFTVVMADWDSQAHKKTLSRTVTAVYSVMSSDQNVAPIDYNLHVGVSECINTSGGSLFKASSSHRVLRTPHQQQQDEACRSHLRALRGHAVICSCTS